MEGEAAAAGITSPDTLGDRRDSDTDLGLANPEPAASRLQGHDPATTTSQETTGRQASPLLGQSCNTSAASISGIAEHVQHAPIA